MIKRLSSSRIVFALRNKMEKAILGLPVLTTGIGVVNGALEGAVDQYKHRKRMTPNLVLEPIRDAAFSGATHAVVGGIFGGITGVVGSGGIAFSIFFPKTALAAATIGSAIYFEDKIRGTFETKSSSPKK